MTEEARAAAREYARAWRKRNPDLVKAKNERYWQKKAEQQRQLDREHQRTG